MKKGLPVTLETTVGHSPLAIALEVSKEVAGPSSTGCFLSKAGWPQPRAGPGASPLLQIPAPLPMATTSVRP